VERNPSDCCRVDSYRVEDVGSPPVPDLDLLPSRNWIKRVKRASGPTRAAADTTEDQHRAAHSRSYPIVERRVRKRSTAVTRILSSPSSSRRAPSASGERLHGGLAGTAARARTGVRLAWQCDTPTSRRNGDESRRARTGLGPKARGRLHSQGERYDTRPSERGRISRTVVVHPDHTERCGKRKFETRLGRRQESQVNRPESARCARLIAGESEHLERIATPSRARAIGDEERDIRLRINNRRTGQHRDHQEHTSTANVFHDTLNVGLHDSG